jgi:hypothetical protein
MEGQVPVNGSGPDEGQLGVEWVPIRRLASIRMYPRFLQAGHSESGSVYRGDVN